MSATPERTVVLEPYVRLLMAMLLFVLGGFAFFIGASDTFGARLMEYKVLGALLLVSAVVLFAGTGSLIVGKRLPVALVASAVGAYVGLNLLLVQLAGLEHDPRIGAWVLMLIAPAACAMVLWRAGVRTSLPRQVGAIVSAGLILSIGQFWYAAQYVPAAIAPALNVSTELEKVGESQTQLALAATISVKNASTTRVRILGSMYRVSAIRRCSTDERAEIPFLDELTRAAMENRTASRFAHDRTVDVVMADKAVMLHDGGWLEPGEEMSRRFLVPITRLVSYDLVRIETVFFLGKGNQLEIETARGPRRGPQHETVDGESYVDTTWRVSDLSLLGRITRGELRIGDLAIGGQRIMVTRWFLSGERPPSAVYPYLSVYIDREGRSATKPPVDDYNLEMERFYGLAAASSSSELSLWPASTPRTLPSQAAGAVPPQPIDPVGSCATNP